MKSAAKAGRGRAGKAAPGKSKVAKKAVKKTAKKAAPKPAKKPAKRVVKPVQPVASPEAKASAELRIEQFVHAYFACNMVGRTAAIAVGYSPESARTIASQLLAREDVQALIAARQAEVLAKYDATQEMVLGRLTGIATADARELTELHRGCCRYCWGAGNLWQRTPREMRQDRADWLVKMSKLPEGELPTEFDEAGGEGYNPKKDPNPNCPECFGDGEARVVFKDTRDLSQAAQLLYAGVEQTQHGLKVRLNSQTDALLNIGKHLGMFGKKVELTGPNGGPVKHEHDISQMFAELEGSETGIGPSSPLPGG